MTLLTAVVTRYSLGANHMATEKAWLYCGLVAAVVLGVGCGPKEQEPPDGGSAGSVASTAAPRPGTEAGAAEGQGMADAARKAVEEATAQAQALIDQTKGFLSEQNYTEAAKGLEKLAGLSLTPEQEKLVAELKVEVSKVNQVVEGELEELKRLVDERKYQEASAKLAGLAEVELTPPQQQLLDKLKAEIQKGLAGQAVESGKKALGGLLQGD
jgi:hypothetical protein